MILQKWREHGWLRIHAPSRQEIADLLGIVDMNSTGLRATTKVARFLLPRASSFCYWIGISAYPLDW